MWLQQIYLVCDFTYNSSATGDAFYFLPHCLQISSASESLLCYIGQIQHTPQVFKWKSRAEDLPGSLGTSLSVWNWGGWDAAELGCQGWNIQLEAYSLFWTWWKSQLLKVWKLRQLVGNQDAAVSGLCATLKNGQFIKFVNVGLKKVILSSTFFHLLCDVVFPSCFLTFWSLHHSTLFCFLTHLKSTWKERIKTKNTTKHYICWRLPFCVIWAQ